MPGSPELLRDAEGGCAARRAAGVAPADRALAWFYLPRPLVRPRLRLICFPYAGGSPTLFRSWPAGLPADVELRAVNLPGRAARLAEAPSSDLLALSEEIADAVAALGDAPFAFFGHSLGALLAFEAARALRRRGAPPPRHLFLAARQAPDIPRDDPVRVAELDDASFASRVAALGGTPPEVLAHDELMSLLLPALRADFLALERWRHRPGRRLSIPITAFAGGQDRGVPVAAVRAWERQTLADFRMHVIDGDHFFLHSRQAELLALLRASLDAPPEAAHAPR